jgi:hypothetical protein
MTEREFMDSYESGRCRTVLFWKSKGDGIGLRFNSLSDALAHIKSPAFQLEEPSEIILEIVFLDSFRVDYRQSSREILDITVHKDKETT